jgi:hypothetical protein
MPLHFSSVYFTRYDIHVWRYYFILIFNEYADTKHNARFFVIFGVALLM